MMTTIPFWRKSRGQASNHDRLRTLVVLTTLLLGAIGYIVYIQGTRQLEAMGSEINDAVGSISEQSPLLPKWKPCSEGQRTKTPIRIHASGEPRSFQQHPSVDIRILAGGANEEPERSFYNPTLLTPYEKIFDNSIRTQDTVPTTKRTYADVYYRSSVCDKDREDAVAVLRRIVEEAGFVFKVGGKCAGTGYSQPENKRTVRDPNLDPWTQCAACEQAKLVVAFERYLPGKTYLSEKVFMPMEHGAIPIYRGNGHKWMDLLSVNRKAFLDRNDYRTEEDFARAVVDLLKDNERMLAMQREPVFTDESMAYKRVMFFKNPGAIGENGIPELYRYVRTEPKFAHLLNKQVLAVWIPLVPVADDIFKVLFNVSRVVRLKSAECADAEFDWCCS